MDPVQGLSSSSFTHSPPLLPEIIKPRARGAQWRQKDGADAIQQAGPGFEYGGSNVEALDGNRERQAQTYRVDLDNRSSRIHRLLNLEDQEEQISEIGASSSHGLIVAG